MHYKSICMQVVHRRSGSLVRSIAMSIIAIIQEQTYTGQVRPYLDIMSDMQHFCCNRQGKLRSNKAHMVAGHPQRHETLFLVTQLVLDCHTSTVQGSKAQKRTSNVASAGKQILQCT